MTANADRGQRSDSPSDLELQWRMRNVALTHDVTPSGAHAPSETKSTVAPGVDQLLDKFTNIVPGENGGMAKQVASHLKSELASARSGSMFSADAKSPINDDGIRVSQSPNKDSGDTTRVPPHLGVPRAARVMYTVPPPDSMNSVPVSRSSHRPGVIPDTGARPAGGTKLDQWKINELEQWFFDHLPRPYPCKDDKARLAEELSLTEMQVHNWFTNMRKRHWAPIKNQKREPKTDFEARLKMIIFSEGAGSYVPSPGDFEDDDGDDDENFD